MRVVFISIRDKALSIDAVQTSFAVIAQTYAMTWQVFGDSPVGTVIMVSRFGHCLFDLVHDWQAGLLPIRIDAVVSNHETQ